MFKFRERPKHGSEYFNCDRRIFPPAGKYGMPAIAPCEPLDLDGCEAIGFNCVLGCDRPENKVVHFHIDDYQFTRVWDDADKYIPILRKFKAVLAPDFSTYEDFPIAVQQYNSYRKAWCAAYWQEHGITVLPTLDWGTNPEHDWFFEGLPRDAVVSVSTIGGFSSKERRDVWFEGFDRALKLLRPRQVLLVGTMWPGISDMYDGEIIAMESDNIGRLKRLQERKKQEEKEKANEVQRVPSDEGL